MSAPLCMCGHPESAHSGIDDRCDICTCRTYYPEPAPAPAPTLRTLMARRKAEGKWKDEKPPLLSVAALDAQGICKCGHKASAHRLGDRLDAVNGLAECYQDDCVCTRYEESAKILSNPWCACGHRQSNHKQRAGECYGCVCDHFHEDGDQS